jgi:hypothetical protein
MTLERSDPAAAPPERVAGSVEQPVDQHAPTDARAALGSGPDPASTSHPIDTLIAGFIVWLARQDVAPDRRNRYHAHAERYLRWQSGGPDPHADRTLWRYFEQLRRAGVSDIDLVAVRTALALLNRYRATAPRASWKRPETRH